MQGCIPRFETGYRALIWFACLTASAASTEVSPHWVDDAQLHDVQLVGSKHAIAVGEHGAIWKSADGGRQWTRLNCGFDISLRSVGFIDDQVGWIAGGDANPYAGPDPGVLLATRDGGKTWQQLGRDLLPALAYVKFFDLDDGVVVGQPTPMAPAGIYKTSDGGKTWRGVQGDAPQGWKAICFLEAELGVVAGSRGRVSLMGGEQIYSSKLPAQGLRSIRAIKLLPGDVGWLAGDGGLVLKTDTGGVVWESPETPLPEELSDGMDFRAVEVRGDKVWLAGSPGSVIWHSPDGGQHWDKQVTGHPVPLAAVKFSSDLNGIAAGAFGTILRTGDGGKSWQATRGEGRRAAVLALHARSGQTSAPLLTKLSGEQGYRSAVWVAQRNDVGPLASSVDVESRLQAAVQRCGAHAADVHWQLPLTVPGLEFSSDKLLAEWQRQTEGRLPQTLLGGLVRQIRTWRPNLVVIDQPSPDDAASQLMFDATMRAVGQAADPTRYVEQTELTGLATWKVDRVYLRLAPGANGDAHVDLDEFLPYLKTSTRIAASSSVALLQGGRVPQTEAVESARIAYRWVGLDGKLAEESPVASRGNGISGPRSRDFFGGLMITPGTAARRDMGPLDEANLERTQKLVQKQRNFTAFMQKSLDDSRLAGQMLGQLNGIVDGMEPPQAVGLLRDLADEYRKRSQFELVESTYLEMIRRYPQEPGSLDAMRWLIQFWCSSETAWQRARSMNSTTTVSRTNPEQQASQVQQALGQSIQGGDDIRQAFGSSNGTDLLTNTAGIPQRLNTRLDLDADHTGNGKSKKPGRLKITRDVDWRTGAVSEWHQRAAELGKKLEANAPNLFRSPEIQFPLAALRRTGGSARGADSIMRNFVTNGIDTGTRQLAERELWASFPTAESPSALAFCREATERPHLDGLLSDPCWEAAQEIRLTAKPGTQEASDDADPSNHSMVMFAYDAGFLYVACSVPRVAGTPTDGPQPKGRQHDADLSRHDRFSIRVDIDRDYSTWYEFQMDQRGWTAESCWEDRRWNPTWYVAAEGDQTDWRVEAAIPWSDLTPTPPRRGAIYGVSILRTIPTVGLQSWIHPATTRPQPSSFGFLKFE
jgi:photosystem II stability/assembly factor-like uncharacterized protein